MSFQGGATGLQRGHGLHNSGSPDVELWGGWDDLYSLEGTTLSSAGLPDCHISPDGPRLHQVLTRLDDMGGARGHGHLG